MLHRMRNHFATRSHEQRPALCAIERRNGYLPLPLDPFPCAPTQTADELVSANAAPRSRSIARPSLPVLPPQPSTTPISRATEPPPSRHPSRRSGLALRTRGSFTAVSRTPVIRPAAVTAQKHPTMHVPVRRQMRTGFAPLILGARHGHLHGEACTRASSPSRPLPSRPLSCHSGQTVNLGYRCSRRKTVGRGEKREQCRSCQGLPRT